MTALQFGIRHSANKPDALQNRGRGAYDRSCHHSSELFDRDRPQLWFSGPPRWATSGLYFQPITFIVTD